MSGPIRKQTQSDFAARVRRVDPRRAATGARCARGPVGRCRLCWALLGFAWIATILAVAQRRDAIEASLAAGTLGPGIQDAVMGGLAVLLGLTSLALAVHFVRALFRTGGARTSRPILAGALAALALAQVPAGILEAGAARLFPASRDLAASVAARASALGLDLGALAQVIPG